METIINEIGEKVKGCLRAFFERGEVRIEDAEKELGQAVSELMLETVGAYYEEKDRELLADKKRRRAEGLCVERRREWRVVQTLLGELRYERTYYRKKDGTYRHPVDEIAGIAADQKVSSGVSLALVVEALESSYAKSSKRVTGGRVSRQTVMHKIRSASPVPLPEGERRRVPVLHVDADEDHVHLQSGKTAIVPLISVYEGVDRAGRRGSCRNVVQYSRYGTSAEALWEEVLSNLEQRYDLTGAKLYIHGDGAAWIKTGLEWLPNSRSVLDPYHKNKALKQLVSGIERKSGSRYEHLTREAAANGDRRYLEQLQAEMLQCWPEREATISGAMTYLMNNLEGISIVRSDPEAAKGGATEPHVSHTLSARLSSRPMGWSTTTLSALAPLLAAGADRVALGTAGQDAQRIVAAPFVRPKRSAKVIPFSLGLPHPDMSISFPANAGKVTPLFTALRPFSF